MRRICIVHFLELEKFPPAMNFIRNLRNRSDSSIEIHVLTSSEKGHALLSVEGVNIHRLVQWKKISRVGRLFQYIQFNILAFAELVRLKPDAILYYESLSAGPPLWYKKFVKRSAKIYVHYHEYTSVKEYQQGMVLNRWLHKQELSWYPKTSWVSHTNADRLKLFLNDMNGRTLGATHVMANYPPRYWSTPPHSKMDGKLRFVYVGALGLDTMYVQEMVEFICSRKEQCCWDIYSSNLSKDVLNYLSAHSCDAIQFKGAIPYDSLPSVLSLYDIGLVLYKGHVPNYIYNIPNKLFEYHVCGLDVWFPEQMESSMMYKTTNTYPMIVPVNFEQLESMDLSPFLYHSGMELMQLDFSCENEYALLTQELIRH